MTEQKYWTEEVYDILANIHPVEIESGVIVPAIQQIIADYQEYIFNTETWDKENIDRHMELINKWQTILKMVEER
jgi:hypothetical protein